MDPRIDNKILRSSTDSELASYFRNLVTRVDNKTICNHILAGISSESLPPRILPVWINGFADESSLITSLHYEHSISVRSIAIKCFGRRLRRENYISLWNAVGGTRGLVELFQNLSVTDVELFCHALGRSSTCSFATESRQAALTELVKSLASDFFPDAVVRNPERRPLLKYYC